MAERTQVIDLSRSLDAVRDVRAQVCQASLGGGDTDHGALQYPSFRHRIERWEDHLEGQIACDTEEHQRVGPFRSPGLLVHLHCYPLRLNGKISLGRRPLPAREITKVSGGNKRKWEYVSAGMQVGNDTRRTE